MKKNIDYYKIKNRIFFNDGFELEPGTIVMFNFEDGELFNLQYEDFNSKRIFWAHKSNLKFKSTEEENWSTSKEKQYQMDLKEKWLDSTNNENEKNNSTSRGNNKSSRKANTTENRSTKNIRSGQTKIKSKLVGRTTPKKVIKRKAIKPKIKLKKTTTKTKRTTSAKK